jgi:hypothetical protein
MQPALCIAPLDNPDEKIIKNDENARDYRNKNSHRRQQCLNKWIHIAPLAININWLDQENLLVRFCCLYLLYVHGVGPLALKNLLLRFWLADRFVFSMRGSAVKTWICFLSSWPGGNGMDSGAHKAGRKGTNRSRSPRSAASRNG